MSSSLFPTPAAPAFPATDCTTTRELLRYEDVAQDGRLTPIALPPRLAGLWQHVLDRHPGSRAAMAQGILPILTRLVMTTTSASIRVDRPVESAIGFALARDDGPGDPARLFMNAWADVHGMAGRIGPPQPDGPMVPAGQLFAEHTFTRPFAAPDQRRVTRLDAAGYPAIPEARYALPAPDATLDAPAGARWRDELADDPTPVVFTLDHTDGNQHVNSLVYVRVFLEATYRRLAALGAPLRIGSRAIEIAYRKPCFAGDAVRVRLRAFDHPDGHGAAGLVVGATDGKPRCYVRALLTA